MLFFSAEPHPSNVERHGQKTVRVLFYDRGHQQLCIAQQRYLFPQHIFSWVIQYTSLHLRIYDCDWETFLFFFLSLSLSQKQRYFSQIAFGLAFLLIMTRGLCRIKSLFKAFSCKPQSSCKKSRQITHFTAIFLTYCEIIKNAKWNMHLPHPTWLLIITKYHSKVYNVRNHENENSCQ